MVVLICFSIWTNLFAPPCPIVASPGLALGMTRGLGDVTPPPGGQMEAGRMAHPDPISLAEGLPLPPCSIQLLAMGWFSE